MHLEISKGLGVAGEDATLPPMIFQKLGVAGEDATVPLPPMRARINGGGTQRLQSIAIFLAAFALGSFFGEFLSRSALALFP